MCRRRGLKVRADRSNVIVMNGEEGLECEVHVDGIRLVLVHVWEFKYLGCVMDESSKDGAEISRKVASGRKVNAIDLHLECARVLHETLLTFGSETMLWEERSWIRAVQMDNLRGLLDIRRMDRVPNARIR